MNDKSKLFEKLIAQCWSDEVFKQELMADPVGVLKSQGIEMPEGTVVKVFENTERIFHLVIPAKPDELSDEALEGAAGGTCMTRGDYTY